MKNVHKNVTYDTEFEERSSKVNPERLRIPKFLPQEKCCRITLLSYRGISVSQIHLVSYAPSVNRQGGM